jgi:hypothetical protein
MSAIVIMRWGEGVDERLCFTTSGCGCKREGYINLGVTATAAV